MYSGGDRWGLGRDTAFHPSCAVISDIQQSIQQWNLGKHLMAEGKVMLKYQGFKGKARNLQQTKWDGCFRERTRKARESLPRL